MVEQSPGESTTYTAWGAIDDNKNAYIRFVPLDPAFPEAVTRLKTAYGSTLHHAELRAKSINERGPVDLTGYDLIPLAEVPNLFGRAGK